MAKTAKSASQQRDHELKQAAERAAFVRGRPAWAMLLSADMNPSPSFEPLPPIPGPSPDPAPEHPSPEVPEQPEPTPPPEQQDLPALHSLR